MTYLLDTNVISELRKPERRADPNVRAWVRARRPSELYLSAITILELEVGIGRIERREPIQGKRLRAWLDEAVLAGFGNRIIPFDLPAARTAARFHIPDPRPERDAMIAATAIEHQMTVVTRNIEDFEPLDVLLVDPWVAAS
ncbi:type II toxin-antitoxin system VapC family toxin [Nocardia rhizosphaerae]|uniref:Ribonuclease VapC n=1 Tax=Nocardia rhizosphaerae TaxID=1691571 RepID=A0ABV8L4P8_9NOCA